jgi:hypothetical protein
MLAMCPAAVTELSAACGAASGGCAAGSAAAVAAAATAGAVVVVAFTALAERYFVGVGIQVCVYG